MYRKIVQYISGVLISCSTAAIRNGEGIKRPKYQWLWNIQLQQLLHRALFPWQIVARVPVVDLLAQASLLELIKCNVL